jgi:threonylcarbamoyladenosine tRNA methylthiotransferase MtaB
MPLRVALITIGCRANQADSAWLARKLDPALVEVVAPTERAELYVVNTCAVTLAAERDARKTISRIERRAGQEPRILLTGCMVAASPDQIKGLGSLWAVVPATERDRIPGLIHELAQELGASESETDCADFHPLPSPLHRARPSLRVQDGCQHGCTYCAVPAGRGAERSMAPDEVLRRLDALRGEGAREVVLCGVNLGRWGRDLRPRQGLADLIRLICQQTPEVRIRISSIEPWALDQRFLEIFGACSNIAPHLHLPIQSGDDGVLRLMGRPFPAGRFEELIGQLSEVRPGFALGTDIMAGFPGEDDRAFERTLELLERIPLAYLHAFGFSPRPGTRASEMDGQISAAELKGRVARLRALGEQKRLTFTRTLVGQRVSPVIEGRERASGLLEGVCGRFVTVMTEGPNSQVGEAVTVLAQEVDEQGRLVGCLSSVDSGDAGSQTNG